MTTQPHSWGQVLKCWLFLLAFSVKFIFLTELEAIYYLGYIANVHAKSTKVTEEVMFCVTTKDKKNHRDGQKGEVQALQCIT